MEQKEEHSNSPSFTNGGGAGGAEVSRNSSIRRVTVGNSAMNSSTRRILNQLNASTASSDGRIMVTGSQELLSRAFNGTGGLNESGPTVVHEVRSDVDRELAAGIGALTIGIQTLSNLGNSVSDLTKTMESAMSTIAAQNDLLVRAMKDQQQVIADQRQTIVSNQETIAQYNRDLVTQNKDLINQNRDLETKIRDVSQQVLSIAKERYNAEARALAAQQSLAAAQHQVPVQQQAHPHAAAQVGYVNPYVYGQTAQANPGAGAFWSVNNNQGSASHASYPASVYTQQQIQAAAAQQAAASSQYPVAQQQSYQTQQQQSHLQNLLRQEPATPNTPQSSQPAAAAYQPPINQMEALIQKQFNQTTPMTTEQVKQLTPQNQAIPNIGAQSGAADNTSKATIASILNPPKPPLIDVQQQQQPKEGVTIQTAPIKSTFSFLPSSNNTSTPSTAAPVNLSFSATTVPAAKQDPAKSPFGFSPSQAGRTKAGSESDGEDHFEPAIDFKPVIPLPDIVEVVTGEEEEEVLFSHRAKLYRWVADLKEFKERGLGDIKILKHRENKKIRIVMRREQVHKICANHFLAPEMELKPMAKSEVAWTWSCYDFSEEEPSSETLAVRFKTKDIAEDFRKVFEQGVKDMGHLKGSSPKKPEATAAAAEMEKISSWGDKFSKKPGSWTCDGCMVTNEADKTTCPCCGTGKDGKPASKPAGFVSNTGPSQPSKPSGFSFGLPAKEAPKTQPIFGTQESKPAAASTGFSLGGFSFNTKPVVSEKAQTTPKTETAKPTTETAPKPSTFKGFSFGTPSTPPKQGAPATKPSEIQKPAESDKVFGFGTNTSNLSFSTLASAEAPAFQSTGKKFPGAGTKLFGATSPANASRQKNASESDGEEQFEPSVEFKPVVPLPNLVEVVTGEEEEEVLFTHRAKLYRWVAELKEFKERGLGDIKILRHRENKKVRIVMRREQVHKICANHFLAPDMELKPMAKSELAWTWSCYDFSEEEPSTETLAIRFKTKETADEFRKVFESGVKEMGELKGVSPKKSEEPKPAPPTSSGFGDKFKPKPGSWTCSGCMLTQDADKVSCPACGTGKDGKPAAAKPSLFGGSSTSGFGTGSSSGLGTGSPSGFSFGLGASDTSKKSSEASPNFGGFSFKTGATKDTTPKTSSTLSSFSFALGKTPTDESKLSDAEKTAKYKLPKDFYSSDSKCGGCMGCQSDEEQDQALGALDTLSTSPEIEDSEAQEELCLWEAQATLDIIAQGKSKETKLGCIKVNWDDDLSGYRILFKTSNDEVAMSHLICKEHRLSEEKAGRGRTKLSWKAIDKTNDDPFPRTFTLTLSSTAKAKEFIDQFDKGLEAAKKNSIEESYTASIAGGSWDKASNYKTLMSSLMNDPMPRKGDLAHNEE